jgi:chemotaxis protein MotB
MSKKDESGEIVSRGGKPARGDHLHTPPRPARRFPFRLLLWALLMTGTTAGAGYYAYQFYQGKEDAEQAAGKAKDDLIACTGDRASVEDGLKRQLQDANDLKAECTTKVASLEKDSEQLAKMSKDFKATEAELKDLRAQKSRYEERLAAMEKFRKEFENLQAGLKVQARRGNLVVSLDAEILFQSASAELAKKGEYAIVQVGGVLKQFSDRKFLVVGHTDKAPLKSTIYKDNWDLSVVRATKVVRVLVDAGVKAENLIAAGAGEHDPVDDKSFAKNRRIEIVLLPAVAELPPLPDGFETKGDKGDK